MCILIYHQQNYTIQLKGSTSEIQVKRKEFQQKHNEPKPGYAFNYSLCNRKQKDKSNATSNLQGNDFTGVIISCSNKIIF